jgi:hypothetical protein
MTARIKFRQWTRRVMYFFPIQLLMLHLKKNHLLLLTWLILFGYVTEGLGVKYGVPNLFLYPEYFGRVNFLSYAILGFALGGFITAFNLYSYTMHGYRFPFILTIARPFLKFNVNNAVIPAVFILTYLWCSARFQYVKELVPVLDIIANLAGALFGVGVFLLLALLYFTRTNTDITKLLGKDPEDLRPEEPLVDIIGPQHAHAPRGGTERRKALRWLRRQQRSEKWRVETYLSPRLRIMLARRSDHYDQELLRDVLWQNHINGSIFEVILVLSFIALGAFSDVGLFFIPAGASAFLLFTMFLMIISALFSWMQGWTGTVVIGTIVLLNWVSHRTERFLYDSQAYGMDYSSPPAAYDRATIAAMANDTATARADADRLMATLEQWKADNAALPHAGERPPLVIVNTSGGGLRALLWTYRCLQVADSLLGGTLMDRTMLISGSSGGLIGATYFRQLYLLGNDTLDRASPERINELSGDMLNPLVFSFVTNDMFIRYRTVKHGTNRYTLDRGATFEQRLNASTNQVLSDLRIGDLAQAEREARIPLLVIAPTSMNDGRRLVIASQPMAFLTNIDPQAESSIPSQPEAIEFQRLFADQGAKDLLLTTALRMNASFPYITPVVTLPSEPPMRVMDAGVRDNYGYRATLAFLHTYREWLAANTGGVVLLQLRDTQKELEVQSSSASLIGRVTDPVGSVYDNFVRVQDQDYDLMLRLAGGGHDFPLHLVDVQLQRNTDEQISLNWHLTALERSRVLRSIGSASNREAFERLKELVIGPATGLLLAGDSAPGPATGPAPRP